MKKIVLLAWLSLTTLAGFCQSKEGGADPAIIQNAPTPEVQDGVLFIGQNASMHISGGGTLTIQDSKLQNNGTFIDTSGTVFITGASPTAGAIEGTGGTTNFNNLTVNKSAGELSVGKAILVAKNLTLTSGNVHIKPNKSIQLLSTGLLLNESETNRVYGTGGHISISTDLNSPNEANPGNLGLEITSTKNLGLTDIIRYHASESVNYSNANAPGSILRQYSVSPTNNTALNATLGFNYLEAELNSNTESAIVGWKRMSPRDSWSRTASATDAANNKIMIYGENVLQNYIAHVTCPTVEVSSNGPICEGLDLNLTSIVSDTVGVQTSYAWTGPNAFTSTDANPMITGISAMGGGNYTLVVTQNNGCSVSAITSVTVNPLPAVPTITADNMTICKGGSVVLTGNCSTVDASFHWTTPSFSSTQQITALPSTNVRTISVPGTYKGLCESKEGCLSAEVSITINQDNNCNGQNFLTITPEKPAICPGGSVTMTATGCSGTVTWFGGPSNQTGASVILSPTATTSYLAQCSAGGSQSFDIVVAANTLAVNQNVITGKERFKAVTTLTSDKKVGDDTYTPGANVIYEAGNSITLLPGFEASQWSVFRAEIKGCQ